MDDTEVPRILWVQCATSAECKTIRIAVSTFKDGWAVLLKLCPEFINKCECVWITTWVKSKDLTWLSWVDAHSIYVDIYNLSSWLIEFSWCMSYTLLNLSLHSKLAFRKKLPISCLAILVPKHGLLASTFKVHWLATGYLIGQAWKNRSSKKSSLETNMRTRTFPSQNACRVKADGMGPSYRRRFPLRCYTQDSTIMVLLV